MRLFFGDSAKYQRNIYVILSNKLRKIDKPYLITGINRNIIDIHGCYELLRYYPDEIIGEEPTIMMAKQDRVLFDCYFPRRIIGDRHIPKAYPAMLRAKNGRWYKRFIIHSEAFVNSETKQPFIVSYLTGG